DRTVWQIGDSAARRGGRFAFWEGGTAETAKTAGTANRVDSRSWGGRWFVGGYVLVVPAVSAVLPRISAIPNRLSMAMAAAMTKGQGGPMIATPALPMSGPMERPICWAAWLKPCMMP